VQVPCIHAIPSCWLVIQSESWRWRGHRDLQRFQRACTTVKSTWIMLLMACSSTVPSLPRLGFDRTLQEPLQTSHASGAQTLGLGTLAVASLCHSMSVSTYAPQKQDPRCGCSLSLSQSSRVRAPSSLKQAGPVGARQLCSRAETPTRQQSRTASASITHTTQQSHPPQ